MNLELIKFSAINLVHIEAPLREYCTPIQKLAGLVLYLNIIFIFLKNMCILKHIGQGNHNAVATRASGFIDQNKLKYCFDQ